MENVAPLLEYVEDDDDRKYGAAEFPSSAMGTHKSLLPVSKSIAGFSPWTRLTLHRYMALAGLKSAHGCPAPEYLRSK